jgi:NitT/TauT family transport system substrate-binding protein
MINKFLFYLLMSFFLPVPAILAQSPVLDKVSLIPHWLPQAQFAGYYVAAEKGIYRKYGLEVEMLRGGPDRPASESLQKGEADFALMMLTTALSKRAQGVKLVNIGQIVQRSTMMLVAKKSRGILHPADLNLKKVGLWGPDYQIRPRAFFQHFNLSVKVIPQGANMDLFLRGAVDAAMAMGYNEYHLLLNAGLNPEELTTFLFADYGLNFPEDGIYCREETLRAQPRLCRQFVRASLEGWRYAFAHLEEALDIVQQYQDAAHVASTRVHQKWMLTHMQAAIIPVDSPVPLGKLLSETYYQVAQVLKKGQLINHVPNYSDFYVDYER